MILINVETNLTEFYYKIFFKEVKSVLVSIAVGCHNKKKEIFIWLWNAIEMVKNFGRKYFNKGRICFVDIKYLILKTCN